MSDIQIQPRSPSPIHPFMTSDIYHANYNWLDCHKYKPLMEFGTSIFALSDERFLLSWAGRINVSLAVYHFHSTVWAHLSPAIIISWVSYIFILLTFMSRCNPPSCFFLSRAVAQFLKYVMRLMIFALAVSRFPQKWRSCCLSGIIETLWNNPLTQIILSIFGLKVRYLML